VTGAAGFIGSHLARRLAQEGWTVRAVDALTPYYDLNAKRANLAAVVAAGVGVVEADLRSAALDDVLAETDVLFHFAAQPGVRASWEDFTGYLEHNVSVTQRLLDHATRHRLTRFVFASSSSVYGQVTGAVTEDSPTRPFSPYGVTKLAAEALCSAYADNFGVPSVSLRLFTVYGPRQRPDMAFHRMIGAALRGEPFTVFGDGSAERSFTFVDDVVDAALLSATTPLPPGTVLNISGGTTCTLNAAIEQVGRAVGRAVPVRYQAGQAGDVSRTDADPARAAAMVGWRPTTPLAVGIGRQVEHMRYAAG
jgi:nucleoside-diphosphate-sugar epimerase